MGRMARVTAVVAVMTLAMASVAGAAGAVRRASVPFDSPAGADSPVAVSNRNQAT